MKQLIILCYLFMIIPMTNAQIPGTESTSKGNNSGNVGIGTTNPTEKLEVKGSVMATQNLIALGRKVYLGSAQQLVGNNTSALTYVSNDPNVSQFILQDRNGLTQGRLYGENGGAAFGLLDSDINWSLKISKDAYTAFLIDNSEKMRILNNGNVGIGTASPQDKLHLANGDLRLSSSREVLFDGVGQIRSADDNHRILFRTLENILELREEGDILFSSGATAGQETGAMIINAAGNVGIGTTTPAHKLDVELFSTSIKTYDFGLEATVITSGGWARSLRFRNEFDQSAASFGSHNGKAFIATGMDTNVDPVGNQYKKLVVLLNGDVGIGLENPTEKLEVMGAIKANNTWIGGGPNWGYPEGIYGRHNLNLNAAKVDSLGGYIVFYSQDVQQMIMFPDGKFGIKRNPNYALDINGYARAIDFYNGSDARYKENLEPIKDGLQTLQKLQGHSYSFKAEKIGGFDFTADKGKRHFGFLAQEVQTVYPHLVSKDDAGYLSVNYIGLIPVLVEALKEQEQTAVRQQATITRQEQEITDLKARMDRLEAIMVAMDKELK